MSVNDIELMLNVRAELDIESAPWLGCMYFLYLGGLVEGSELVRLPADGVGAEAKGGGNYAGGEFGYGDGQDVDPGLGLSLLVLDCWLCFG